MQLLSLNRRYNPEWEFLLIICPQMAHEYLEVFPHVLSATTAHQVAALCKLCQLTYAHLKETAPFCLAKHGKGRGRSRLLRIWHKGFKELFFP